MTKVGEWRPKLAQIDLNQIKAKATQSASVVRNLSEENRNKIAAQIPGPVPEISRAVSQLDAMLLDASGAELEAMAQSFVTQEIVKGTKVEIADPMDGLADIRDAMLEQNRDAFISGMVKIAEQGRLHPSEIFGILAKLEILVDLQASGDLRMVGMDIQRKMDAFGDINPKTLAEDLGRAMVNEGLRPVREALRPET